MCMRSYFPETVLSCDGLSEWTYVASVLFSLLCLCVVQIDEDSVEDLGDQKRTT